MKWDPALTQDRLFDSDHLGRDLARRTVRGGMTTMVAQGFQFALNTAGTMVLARLLTPKDHGLVGMVAVVVNFAAMFRDAGLSTATVQKEAITHEQISTLFWLNVLISAGLGVCVLAGSPLVALFYGRPELTAVTAALSLSFIVSGLTIQHQALQRRHMHFSSLARIRTASQVMALAVTVALACLGCRYWALVGGTLTNALVGMLLTFASCPWIPGPMQRGTGVREMLRFGGHLTGFAFVNYFSRNGDNILIGRFIGADALGLYSKAYSLFLLPISQVRAPIDEVSLPVLCASRHDHERYRSYYRRAIFVISALSIPSVGFSLVFADNIILLALGRQWLGAVEVFQVLAAVGLFQCTAQAGRGLPLMSMGFSRRYFHFGVVQSAVTVLGIAVGLHWGIVGVAAGYGIAFYLLIPPTIAWCLNGSPVTPRDWLIPACSPALASLAMFPLMIWAKSFVQQGARAVDLPTWVNLEVMAIGGMVGMAAYGLAVLSMPIARESLRAVAKQLRCKARGPSQCESRARVNA